MIPLDVLCDMFMSDETLLVTRRVWINPEEIAYIAEGLNDDGSTVALKNGQEFQLTINIDQLEEEIIGGLDINL